MIVLDTNALIFWTLNPSDLSKSADSTIQNADQIIVSAISIWEIGIKSAKGKLSLGGSLEKYVEALRQVDRVEIQAVDETIWMENVKLKWAHRDPADRTIVATAKLLDCELVTSDREIRSFYKKSVW